MAKFSVPAPIYGHQRHFCPAMAKFSVPAPISGHQRLFCPAMAKFSVPAPISGHQRLFCPAMAKFSVPAPISGHQRLFCPFQRSLCTSVLVKTGCFPFNPKYRAPLTCVDQVPGIIVILARREAKSTRSRTCTRELHFDIDQPVKTCSCGLTCYSHTITHNNCVSPGERHCLTSAIMGYLVLAEHIRR